jgi:hypothetical protein
MKHLKRFALGAVVVALMVAAAWLLILLADWLYMWQYSPLMFKCIFGTAFVYCVGGVLLSAWPIMRGRR